MTLIGNKEYLYFINGSTRIQVDHSIISKVSKQISEIKWDADEPKEICILNILPSSYSSKDVEAVITQVITVIQTGSRLGVETSNVPGIYRVKGDLSSLKVLLLVILWLNIDSLLEEILLTLHVYPLKFKYVKAYLEIYDDILRYHKKEGYENALRTFLKFDRSSKDQYTPIINELIHFEKLDVYNRYQLALKYELPYPRDDITHQTTARRLYNLNPHIRLPIIRKEIDAVEETKLILADSILKYNLATRIGSEAVPNVAGRHGLFWFYVQNVDDNYIYTGKIHINNVDYNILIQQKDNSLLSIPEFEEKITMVTSEKDRKSFATLKGLERYTEVRDEFGTPDFDVYYVLQNNDSRYRQHLHHLGLLTQKEMEFQKKRRVIVQMYHQIKACIRTANSEYTPQFRKFVSQYILCIYELGDEESAYYTSNVGIKLEQDRRYIRHHFESLDYNGIVVLLDMIDIIKIEHGSNPCIIIKNCRLQKDVYYTRVLPSLDDIKNQDELIFQLLTYKTKGYMTINNYRHARNPHTTVYGKSETKIDLHILNTLHFYFQNERPCTNNYFFGISDPPEDNPDYNLNLSTFYMVDPSTIDDIKEVIEKSDPYISLTDYPRTIVAFPHLNPRIFFRAGLADVTLNTNGTTNVDMGPYIHYTYTHNDKMDKIVRCNSLVCQSM
jgi:hypothetical protein